MFKSYQVFTSCSSCQPLAPSSGPYDSYWKYGPSGSQNHLAGSVQPQYQKPSDSYGSFQDQQKTSVGQVANFQYSTSHQVPQNYQPSVQSTPSSDRRANMVHIPTNPRIASNLPLGLQKADKDSSNGATSIKPAYISVSLPKATEKVSSHDSADSVLKVRSYMIFFCSRPIFITFHLSPCLLYYT